MAKSTRARLPAGSLNRDVILDGALRALARPGSTGLTMRTLAEELGADPSAMYRHFDGKAALLGALTDRLLAPVDALEPAGSWREQLAALATVLRRVFQDHPGAIFVIAESPFTPMTLGALERTVAALAAAGLDPRAAAEVTQAVVVFVIGHAATSTPEDGFWAELLDAAPAAAELPSLRATAATWQAPAERQFATGLALLLDGVRS